MRELAGKEGTSSLRRKLVEFDGNEFELLRPRANLPGLRLGGRPFREDKNAKLQPKDIFDIFLDG